MMFRIPTTKPDNFVPKEIVHVLLTIDSKGIVNSGGGSFNLEFKANISKSSILNSSKFNETQVMDKAIELARAVPLAGIMAEDSPFDIVIENQCWILIELDGNIKNWQFAKGERGVTAKVDTDNNCHLRHIYETGADPVGAVISREGCRILYFGVVARAAKGDPGSSEFFNFHTEFLTPGRDAEGNPIPKRLKVIFDPDIKNEGTKIP